VGEHAPASLARAAESAIPLRRSARPFALANAATHLSGDVLRSAATSPVTLGVLLACVVGKPLGITATARALPLPTIAGGGVMAGVGFTVSLLLSGLAFSGRPLEQPQPGVLAAAVPASAGGSCRFASSHTCRSPSGRGSSPTQSTRSRIPPTRRSTPCGNHLRGAENAPVSTAITRARTAGGPRVVVRELLVSFGDQLRYVWRHLPLSDVHPDAQMAAEEAEAPKARSGNCTTSSSRRAGRRRSGR
jgi:hypothetical protein